MKQENGNSNLPSEQLEQVVTAQEKPAIQKKSVIKSIFEKISSWMSIWIFSYDSTYLPLVFLWFLGVIWAVFEMMRALPQLIKREEAGVLTPWFIGLIAFQLFLGFLHQFIVFRCIHVFDSDKATWVKRFPNWIGTNVEWGLRGLILLSLLTVGGEVPLLIKHIRDALQSSHHHLHEIPFETYPASSVFLYSLLIIWDIAGALRFPSSSGSLSKIKKLLWSGLPLTFNQVYFYSDVLCFIFWLAILWCARDRRIGPMSFFLVLLTSVFFTIMTIYRIVSHIKSQGAKPD